MTGQSGLETRRMTPDDVLRVLADSHRQQCQYDPGADPRAVISPKMTVAKWRSACDLVEWRLLGVGLNEWFGTSFSEEEWKRVLTPPKKRTIQDVCDLLASQAVVQVINPLKVSGTPCMPAGAFFAVRTVLSRAGADVSTIRPSSPMGQFLRRWAAVVLNEITKIAPGALPSIRVEKPFYDRSVCLLAVGWLLALVSSILQRPLLVLGCLVLILFGYIGVHLGARLQPRRVSFGDLITFGDMARAIAAKERKPTS